MGSILSPLSDLDEHGLQFRYAFEQRSLKPVISSSTTGTLQKEVFLRAACSLTMARAHMNTTAMIKLTGTDRTSEVVSDEGASYNGA
jgi:hypothetical protein